MNFKLHIDLLHSSDSSNNQTDNFASETMNLTFQEVTRQISTWFRSHNIIFVTVSTSLPYIWRVYSSKFSCSGFSVLTLDDRVEQNIKEMYCHLLDCRLDTVVCFEVCDTHEVHQTFLFSTWRQRVSSKPANRLVIVSLLCTVEYSVNKQ